MNQPTKICSKAVNKLKLKLLPPPEAENPTRADVINFYRNLIKVFYYEK